MDSDAMMMEVWYRLYYENSNKVVGSSDKVTLKKNADVADLRKAVKDACPNSLEHVESAELKVYAWDFCSYS